MDDKPLSSAKLPEEQNSYAELLDSLRRDLGLDLPSPYVQTTLAVQTAAPAAGGAGALPATPKGYLTILVAGVPRLIPYY